MKYKKFSVFNIVSTLLLLVITFIFVFPFYWVITGSFKEQRVAIKLPPEWFPRTPTIANFITLFKNPAMKWFSNSVVISLAAMALVCAVSALAGYVLAKKKFPGRNFIFMMFVG